MQTFGRGSVVTQDVDHLGLPPKLQCQKHLKEDPYYKLAMQEVQTITKAIP